MHRSAFAKRRKYSLPKLRNPPLWALCCLKCWQKRLPSRSLHSGDSCTDAVMNATDTGLGGHPSHQQAEGRTRWLPSNLPVCRADCSNSIPWCGAWPCVVRVWQAQLQDPAGRGAWNKGKSKVLSKRPLVHHCTHCHLLQSTPPGAKRVQEELKRKAVFTAKFKFSSCISESYARHYCNRVCFMERSIKSAHRGCLPRETKGCYSPAHVRKGQSLRVKKIL